MIMFDICLLGTGGTMPLPNRGLTALMAKYNGKSVLIDCGEGTQIMLQRKGWSMKPIDVILFTHFHADHMVGLPGLLLSMGKAGRTEAVKIIGPAGIKQVVDSLCIVAPELPFEVECVEIDGSEQSFQLADLRIDAFELEHSIQCYGYSLSIDRAGKFNPKAALDLGIEKCYWGRLQKGECIDVDGKHYTPEMVMGEPRKGLKVTYCTDTRPTESIKAHAQASDLFICEGMYADEEKFEKAIINKHMMFSEAAAIAKTANVNELWLTHFSPSINNPYEYLETVREIFPNTIIPEDLISIDLKFSDIP